MKEQTLVEMRNQISQLGQVANKLIQEVELLKTLGLGNIELVKHLPGYEDALNILKEQENGKENTDGITTGDSGTTDSGLELE